jgi:hypothetical protein
MLSIQEERWNFVKHEWLYESGDHIMTVLCIHKTLIEMPYYLEPKTSSNLRCVQFLNVFF